MLKILKGIVDRKKFKWELEIEKSLKGVGGSPVKSYF